MKRALAFLLLVSVVLLTACGAKPAGTADPANSGAPTASAPDGAPTQPVTEPTAEEPTEPPAQPDRSVEYIYENHPELTPVDYDSPALLPLTEDAGQEYIDKLIWICDSPTYWLKGLGLLKDGTSTKQIWTGPECTMTLAYLRDFKLLDPWDGKERTIAETAALHKPEFIVIAVGVNGISFMDEDYFTREYTHLIDVLQEASPDTTILLQAIYPIAPNYKYWGRITNASITKGNSWILHIAEQYGLKYIDAFAALVGEDGNIVPELVMRDGLHPNKDGLTKVLEYIRTHAYTE